MSIGTSMSSPGVWAAARLALPTALMTGFDAESCFRAAAAAHRAGDLAAAEAGYRRVLETAPQPRPALHNLALILAGQNRLEELVEIDRVLVALAPSDALHWRLATSLLSLGRFAEAWPHYEHRPRKIPPATNVPEWRGEPLAGKSLLVWHDEGYGDQFLMARFLRRLDAAHVAWAVMPPLLRLFSQLCPTISRLGHFTGRFDYWADAMALPARLRATPQDLPKPPYITAAPRLTGARIGVIGSGDPRAGAHRSLPQHLTERLLDLPGAISLDPARTGAADFQDTAEIIAGLDLVISIDTAVAHLAGAMGKPLYVLLPEPADWRWPHRGDTTPWHPSARLFRQTRPGDWEEVVERVMGEVRAPRPLAGQ
jgi:tetratricopeptide (TPR) repeat protein